MRASIRLGRPFGIPVGLHWSALLVGALAVWALTASFASTHPGYGDSTYLVGAVLAVGLYFAGLVVHELAHALVARRFGVGTKGVTLWALGGLAELDRQPPSARAELLVAGAGPLASLTIGAAATGLGLATGALTGAGVLAAALLWVGIVNLLLGAFNLLPARPMDGGRVLTALLWKRSGDRSAATLAASKVATVLSWGLLGLGVFLLVTGGFGGLWLALVGWIVMGAARAERQLIGWQRQLGAATAGQLMEPPALAVPPWTDVHAAVVAASHDGRAQVLVVDHEGRPVGETSAATLLRAGLSNPGAAVAEISSPLPAEALVRVDEPVAALLTGERGARFPLVVLAADGTVAGELTPAGLERWVRYRTAGAAAWPAPRPEPHPVS